MEGLNKEESVVVVTGSSSGIGKDLCRMLLSKGYKVFGTTRSKSDSITLSKELGSKFSPLILDVTVESQVINAKNEVEKYLAGRNLSALVNNAGVATVGPVEHMSTVDFTKQINAKLLGTFICTKVFLPLLGTDKLRKGPSGRIINISSILGGKIGVPFMSSYCASKHAVEAFSESLRRELLLHGIKVIIVAPGSISTPIWNTVKNHSDEKSFADTEYNVSFEKMIESLNQLNKNSLPVEKLSRIIIDSIESKNPKLRYSPTNNYYQKFWPLIPRKFMDKLFSIAYNLKSPN